MRDTGNNIAESAQPTKKLKRSDQSGRDASVLHADIETTENAAPGVNLPAPAPSPQVRTGRHTMNGSTSDFAVVMEQCGFVDKSLMLNTLLPDEKAKAADIFIVTAPRRSGKSTILSMVNACLNIQAESVRATEKFKKLKIMDSQYEHKREQYFGKCPVIFLDLICTTTLHSVTAAHKICKKAVHRAYLKHEYLYQNESDLKPEEKTFCENWCSANYDAVINDHEIEEGLKDLSLYLRRYHQAKPYLLVDEYDNMISKSLKDKTGERLTIAMETFTNLLTTILKNNDENLEGALITGILPIHGNSPSDFNNAVKCTFLDGHQFTEFYGLTSTEISNLTSRLHRDYNITISQTEKDVIKSMYNGYFSKTGVNLYSIWSVEKYISDGRVEAEGFWNDSGYVANFDGALKAYNLKHKLEDILRGDPFELEVLKIFTEEDLWKLCSIESNPNGVSAKLFFSFLLHQGYLTYVKGKYTHVKVPNLEIEKMFLSKMYENYSSSITSDFLSVASQDCLPMFRSLQSAVYGSDDTFEAAIKKFKCKLQSLFNKFSAICIKMNEPFIHLFMSHLIVHAGTFELGPEMHVKRTGKTKTRLDQVAVETTQRKFAIVFEYQHDRGQRGHNSHGSLNKIIEKEYENVFKDTKLFPSEQYNIERYLQVGISINNGKAISLKCLSNDKQISQAVFVDYYQD